MREFKLHNANMTASFNLSSSSIKATDVSGLGSSYENIIADQSGLRKKMLDKKSNFESITLTIIFGINSNAYTDYANLMNFIVENKKNKFVFEYKVNNSTKYIDVALSKAPKSQKIAGDIISENFEFEKLSPFYSKETQSTTSLLIENSYFDSILPKIKITSCTNPVLIKLRRAFDDSIVQTVEINRAIASPQYFEVDSENRLIVYFDGVVVSSAYNDLTFGGGKTAFIEIPPGNYYIENDQSVSMMIEYKKWVMG